MPADNPGEVTRLLRQISTGGKSTDQLFELIYSDFRALAHSYFQSQPRNRTLQPTAVVHEAYLRLVDQTRADYKDRNHFFAVGALAMRQILVNHATAKGADKRGGKTPKVELNDAAVFLPQDDEDVLAIDEALKELVEVDERQAKIVELRFFGGLSMKETADVLDVSERTLYREWRMCRAWLRNRLGARQ